ncbi:50S ribosomal protein L28 [Candidatus Gracilibacteria bacterium]|nr:50S ribosomal protein L28 [Candidatus Gracilibacteria bacterium]
MSRVCQLTGKKTGVGNKVSHSVRRTKRKFLPNLFWKYIKDSVTGIKVRVRLSAKAIKTLKKDGVL